MVDVRLVHPAKLTFPGVCSLYTTEPKLGVVFSHYPLFKGGEMCDCPGMGYPLPFFRVCGVQRDLSRNQETPFCSSHVHAACGSKRSR